MTEKRSIPLGEVHIFYKATYPLKKILQRFNGPINIYVI